MLALRRSRMASAPAFLRGGFRPFFFGGPAWAVIALTLWILALAGAFAFPSHFGPLVWHRHEMLFGFVGAVVAGFLLTAIPNWTGRLPIAGPPLAALFGLWVAARIALLFSNVTGALLAALLDSGFYVLLAILAGREVLAAKNRNLPVVALVLLLGGASLLDHLGVAGTIGDDMLGMRAGIGIVIMLISLIGGRIVPSFTRNWMSRHGITQRLPGQPTRYDLATLAMTGFALLGWVILPASPAAGPVLVAAGLMQFVRLARWGGMRAIRDPLVFILHVGYFWVPTGLVLLGASLAGAAIPTSIAIHALTAGAMATMILAVMTRATLGHTGRPLVADWPTTMIYALVTIGAVLRVTATFGPYDYMLAMRISALAWGLAFLTFLAAYGPMLMRPHVADPLR